MQKEREIKMKFSKRVKILALAAGTALTVAAVGAVLATEYSVEDPLISKSYIDSVFYPQITAYIDQTVEQATAQSSTETSSEYQVITLTNGQTLAATGSLEFILRPGASATVVSPIAENGIANLTDGSELYDGNSVPINAYCLIPRGDGRGIVCTSETAYVMVRGAYEIR